MPPILTPDGRRTAAFPQQPSLESEMAENQNAGTKIPAEIAALSFEEALAQLQDLVKKLERGDNKLDEAIGSYERGAVQHQIGADPLAAAHGGIAHRLDHAGFAAGHRRDQLIQHPVGRARGLVQRSFDLHLFSSCLLVRIHRLRADRSIGAENDLLDLHLRFAQLGLAMLLQQRTAFV